MTSSDVSRIARRIVHWAIVYGGAVLCGYIASRLHVPLAWTIGSMMFGIAFRLTGRELDIPTATRKCGQVLVGSSVGLAFTPEAFAAMGSLIVPMVLAAVLTILFSFVVGAFLKITAKVDVVTATLAALPAGPVESAVLSKKHGVDPGPVIFNQTFRIVALVTIIPPLLVLLDGKVRDPAAVLANSTWTPEGGALLLAISIAGAFIARAIHFANPFFLGALGASALAAVLGAPVTGYPYAVLAMAQIFLGIFLGSAFERALVRKLGRFIPTAAAAAVLMAALCAVMGLALAYWTGVPWQVMVLATAPGSATEMALTAKILQQGLAIVTAFHVMRIFIIMPSAQFIIGLTARLAAHLEARRARREAA